MRLKIARAALAGGGFILGLFGGYSLITHFAQSFFQPAPVVDDVASMDADAEGVEESRSAAEAPTDASLHAARFTDSQTLSSAAIQDDAEIPDTENVSPGNETTAGTPPLEHRPLADKLPPDQFASSPRSVVMSGGSLPTGEEDDSVLPSGDEEGPLIGVAVPGISLDVPLAWSLPGEILLGLELPPEVVDLLNLAETSLPGAIRLGLSVDDSGLPSAYGGIPLEVSAGLDLGDGLIDQPIGVAVAIGTEENSLSAGLTSAPLVQTPVPTVQIPVVEDTMASPEKPTTPGQQSQQRRPGMIYGNALGGSVSGLIGGLQAPPEGSVVRYRPGEPLARNGSRARTPGFSQGLIYSSNEAGASALPALAVEVAPLGAVSVGIGTSATNGSPGTALPQGLSGLVSPTGIGINLGGLDVRVNTSISIP